MSIHEKLSALALSRLNISFNSFKYIGGGSFGKVYRAEDEGTGTVYIFKLYLVDGMAEVEAASLKALAQNSTVKIPMVYFVHTKNEEFAFDCLCMEYINGKNALMNLGLLLASKGTKQRFADEVVDGLLAIHSIESENGKFGSIANPQCNSWLEYYRPFARDIYKNAIQANEKGSFDQYILDTMKIAWERFDDIFDSDVYKPSLIHGDINVMNIMVDKKYNVTAFIDPLNSIYADREYDIFQLQNMTGNYLGLYDAYKKKYHVSEKCDLKCAFYALWNEAMVYLRTGSYTGFIMRASVKRMKNELKKIQC